MNCRTMFFKVVRSVLGWKRPCSPQSEFFDVWQRTFPIQRCGHQGMEGTCIVIGFHLLSNTHTKVSIVYHPHCQVKRLAFSIHSGDAYLVARPPQVVGTPQVSCIFQRHDASMIMLMYVILMGTRKVFTYSRLFYSGKMQAKSTLSNAIWCCLTCWCKEQIDWKFWIWAK